MSEEVYGPERAQRLVALLRTLAARIQELDRAGRLLDAAPELQKLLGNARSELFHYEVRSTYDTPDVAESRRIVDEALGGELFDDPDDDDPRAVDQHRASAVEIPRFSSCRSQVFALRRSRGAMRGCAGALLRDAGPAVRAPPVGTDGKGSVKPLPQSRAGCGRRPQCVRRVHEGRPLCAAHRIQPAGRRFGTRRRHADVLCEWQEARLPPAARF